MSERDWTQETNEDVYMYDATIDREFDNSEDEEEDEVIDFSILNQVQNDEFFEVYSYF